MISLLLSGPASRLHTSLLGGQSQDGCCRCDGGGPTELALAPTPPAAIDGCPFPHRRVEVAGRRAGRRRSRCWRSTICPMSRSVSPGAVRYWRASILAELPTYTSRRGDVASRTIVRATCSAGYTGGRALRRRPV